jgi:hypothetical protein
MHRPLETHGIESIRIAFGGTSDTVKISVVVSQAGAAASQDYPVPAKYLGHTDRALWRCRLTLSYGPQITNFNLYFGFGRIVPILPVVCRLRAAQAVHISANREHQHFMGQS